MDDEGPLAALESLDVVLFELFWCVWETLRVSRYTRG